MLGLLVELLVLVLVLGIFYWAITQIPLPQPARVVVNVVFALIVVLLLLAFVGWLPWGWPHHTLRF